MRGLIVMLPFVSAVAFGMWQKSYDAGFFMIFTLGLVVCLSLHLFDREGKG